MIEPALKYILSLCVIVGVFIVVAEFILLLVSLSMIWLAQIFGA
jgi:hypothetical protein